MVDCCWYFYIGIGMQDAAADLSFKSQQVGKVRKLIRRPGAVDYGLQVLKSGDDKSPSSNILHYCCYRCCCCRTMPMGPSAGPYGWYQFVSVRVIRFERKFENTGTLLVIRKSANRLFTYTVATGYPILIIIITQWLVVLELLPYRLLRRPRLKIIATTTKSHDMNLQMKKGNR
jgi:hypothetical protein